MIVLSAMLMGALANASWVAPKPWCYVMQVLVVLIFVMIRRVP